MNKVGKKCNDEGFAKKKMRGETVLRTSFALINARAAFRTFAASQLQASSYFFFVFSERELSHFSSAAAQDYAQKKVNKLVSAMILRKFSLYFSAQNSPSAFMYSSKFSDLLKTYLRPSHAIFDVFGRFFIQSQKKKGFKNLR